MAGTARRTTQAVRVGSAKGKGANARRAVGYAGRTATGSRGGMSDTALSANNRGSGGKAAINTGVGSAGGVSGGGGGSGSQRPGVVETTTPAGGGSARTPVPRKAIPRVDRSFEGEQVALRSSTVSRTTPTATTVTKRVSPAPAKPPTKKPVAKKPTPRGARHGTRAVAAPKPKATPKRGARKGTRAVAAPKPKPKTTTRRPTTRRSTARH